MKKLQKLKHWTYDPDKQSRAEGGTPSGRYTPNHTEITCNGNIHRPTRREHTEQDWSHWLDARFYLNLMTAAASHLNTTLLLSSSTTVTLTSATPTSDIIVTTCFIISSFTSCRANTLRGVRGQRSVVWFSCEQREDLKVQQEVLIRKLWAVSNSKGDSLIRPDSHTVTQRCHQ